MKYEILYLLIAQRDITRISDTLSGHPVRARRLFGEIESKLKLLKFMPHMWPSFDPRPELRKMDLEDHMLFYLVDESQRQVTVYRVLYDNKAGADEQASVGRIQGSPNLRVVDIETAKSALSHELAEAADD